MSIGDIDLMAQSVIDLLDRGDENRASELLQTVESEMSQEDVDQLNYHLDMCGYSDRAITVF